MAAVTKYGRFTPSRESLENWLRGHIVALRGLGSGRRFAA